MIMMRMKKGGHDKQMTKYYTVPSNSIQRSIEKRGKIRTDDSSNSNNKGKLLNTFSRGAGYQSPTINIQIEIDDVIFEGFASSLISGNQRNVIADYLIENLRVLIENKIRASPSDFIQKMQLIAVNAGIQINESSLAISDIIDAGSFSLKNSNSYPNRDIGAKDVASKTSMSIFNSLYYRL